MSLFRDYGLLAGEPVSVKERTKKGSAMFQERPPDAAKVVAEYPFFIQVRGTWSSVLHTYEYDFAVNKADIYTGAVDVVRLSTGEKLKALELQEDYVRRKEKEKHEAVRGKQRHRRSHRGVR